MRAAAVLLVLLPALARAHDEQVHERAVLQFRPDGTGVLYELNFPPGAAAARWRLLFDLDRNGRLSASEYGRLAKGIANAVADAMVLTLERSRVPLRVVDAKVTPSPAPDGFSGKLAAIVLLEARALPPGLRRVELALTPVVDRERSAAVRLEPDHARIESLIGGRPGGSGPLGETVLVGRRDRVTLHLDVPRAGVGP